MRYMGILISENGFVVLDAEPGLAGMSVLAAAFVPKLPLSLSVTNYIGRVRKLEILQMLTRRLSSANQIHGVDASSSNFLGLNTSATARKKDSER
jgi:hypothetical protein